MKTLRHWLRTGVLAAFFNSFRWYRRLAGGKWELWWIDSPVCSHIWHDVNFFNREMKEASERLKYHPPKNLPADALNPYYWEFRPSPLCRGTPIEEDWS